MPPFNFPALDPSSSTRQAAQQESSGGGGPTYGGSSGSSSSSSAGGARPSAVNQRAGIVHWSHLVTIAVDNRPQPLPGYHVPEGCNVRLRAVAANAQTAFYANYRDKLLSNNGTPLAPLDDVQEQATNLANIWIMGKAGDSIAVSVQTQAKS